MIKGRTTVPNHDLRRGLPRQFCEKRQIMAVRFAGVIARLVGKHGYERERLRHRNAHVLKHRIGHANIRTTYDLYAHAMPGEDAPAAETLDQLLRGRGGR